MSWQEARLHSVVARPAQRGLVAVAYDVTWHIPAQRKYVTQSLPATLFFERSAPRGLRCAARALLGATRPPRVELRFGDDINSSTELCCWAALNPHASRPARAVVANGVNLLGRVCMMREHGWGRYSFAPLGAEEVA